MRSNKKLQPIVIELFITEGKLKIFFINQSYFVVLKNIRLTSTHYFIVKV